MPAARVEYIAPWWVVWLHSVPHLGLRLQPVDSTFRPRDESYQESLLFLGLVAAICLGLNLIFLAAYLVCACCCRQNDAVQTKRRNSCCVTWTAVVAGLICCAAVGVGFYGNSETNDGVYQLIYSLDNANSTFSGIDELVSGTTQRMKVDLEQHLARLSEIFAARGDYLQTLKFIQQMAGSILVQMAGVPAWREVTMQLTELADQTGYVEYYRWLSYLLLFVLDLVICLLTCLGLAKRSRCLLASMLCCGMLALLLSWTSLAADAAAAVVRVTPTVPRAPPPIPAPPAPTLELEEQAHVRTHVQPLSLLVGCRILTDRLTAGLAYGVKLDGRPYPWQGLCQGPPVLLWIPNLWEGWPRPRWRPCSGFFPRPPSPHLRLHPLLCLSSDGCRGMPGPTGAAALIYNHEPDFLAMYAGDLHTKHFSQGPEQVAVCV
uniref:Protein tweety homolog n=1 Tax=Sus scrofa TaxID=9823 RepID=A0A5G2RD44_PIG